MGCSLQVIPSGQASIVSPAATDVSVDNKGAYFGTIAISVSNASIPGALVGGSGAGTLNGTSTTCTNNGQPAVLQGDNTTVSVTGVNPETGLPAGGTVTVMISDAGQTSTMTD